MQTFKGCSRNTEFGNENVLVRGGGGGIVVTVSEEESQYEVEDDIATEDVGIEENVGETSFEMSASAANGSGQDNQVKIEKELG